MLAQNAGVSLPKEALYVVRYHSMYPWHEQDCYAELENDCAPGHACGGQTAGMGASSGPRGTAPRRPPRALTVCAPRLAARADDRCMKGWVKLFNQHDLYTKRDTLYSAAELAEMKAYYSTLVDKYLPAQLDF